MDTSPGIIGKDKIELRKFLDKRMSTLMTDRDSWMKHWKELSNFIQPRVGRFMVDEKSKTRGSRINNAILDNTGTIAARTLSSGMMSGITSPARPWFKLTLADEVLARNPNVALWLEEAQKRMAAVFAKSNFYPSLATMYEELPVFGVAAMLIYEDREDVIRCYNLTIGEYALVNDERYNAAGLYREFPLTVEQVVNRFGYENCSDTVKSQYGMNGQQGIGRTNEIIICHAIDKNFDRIEGKPGKRGMLMRDIYWEKGSSCEYILSDSGFVESPICAPRWQVIGNEAYASRCPGMEALGDIKQLQTEQKRKAQGIDKMVNPPMVGDVRLRNEPASVLPGGITYIDNPAGAGFKPVYMVDPKINELNLDIQQCQRRIKDCFFVDLFLGISQLDTTRSATEILERKEEKLIMLGPVLERVHNEMLDPAVTRTFGIMLRNGLFPPPPQELGDQEIQIEYISMLAQAQKAVATAGIEKMVAFVGNLAASQPSVLDKINFDAAIDEYGIMLGVSGKIVRPQDQVDATRSERMRAQQQQIAMEQGMAAVQGAKVLSDTPVGRGGTALDQILGGIQ